MPALNPNDHFISLDDAVKLTRRFRQNREEILRDDFKNRDVLPLAETFNKEAFKGFFDNDNCRSIRIYLGMKEDLTLHSIIVGVDDQNRDILPSNKISRVENMLAVEDTLDTDIDPDLLENSQRCPPDCPETSPLNTDIP